MYVSKNPPFSRFFFCVLRPGEWCDFNSPKIAKSLGAKVFVESKKTVSAARHKGLFNATGDVVCFIDADVLPDILWFEKLTSPFEDKTVMAVAGRPRPIQGKFMDKRKYLV